MALLMAFAACEEPWALASPFELLLFALELAMSPEAYDVCEAHERPQPLSTVLP